MGRHPIYILKKVVNWMKGIRFSNFVLKKNRRLFWSFLQGQFWHFQNLWRCRTRVLGCRKNLSV